MAQKLRSSLKYAPLWDIKIDLIDPLVRSGWTYFCQQGQDIRGLCATEDKLQHQIVNI